MSRIDEFSSTVGTSRIARLEWRDGTSTSWGDDFVQDPNDSTKKYCILTGVSGGDGLVEVTYTDGSVRAYVVKVGQKVSWDASRGTYTFPR
jgi:hypothetical protein